MHYRTFYRWALVLPLALPGSVGLARLYGFEPSSELARGLTQLALIILLYGGLPYGVLLIGAWVWLNGRSEPEIRRVAKRAPLFMVGVFMVLSTYVGIRSRELDMFLAFSALGGVMSLLVGYLVVGLVFLVRYAAGRAGLVVNG